MKSTHLHLLFLFYQQLTQFACIDCVAGGVDGSTQTGTSTTVDTGTQTEVDVIYITDLAKYFHDIADKLGSGASLYSTLPQVSTCVLIFLFFELHSYKFMYVC